MKRRDKRRLIRAAARNDSGLIRFDAETVEWIKAEGQADGPKKVSVVAYTGGALQVNAWDYPVVIDLAGLKAEAPLPLLLNHDMGQIVGHADDVTVTATAVKLKGLISGASPAAQQVQASAAAGFPWKASVGARPDKREFIGEGITAKANGKTFTGPLYIARKSTLGEVSFVAVAADQKTSATVAASAANSTKGKLMDPKLTAWIEALGLNADELRDDQKTKLEEKWRAEIKASAASGESPRPPAFDIQAISLAYSLHDAKLDETAATYAEKVEAAKLLTLKATAAKSAAGLRRKALEEEWAAPRLEAEYIKAAAIFESDLIAASRPASPAIHSSQRDISAPVIEAAFAKTCGLNVEKTYKPEILEAADRQFKNLGLQELLLICAGMNGYGGRMRINDGNIREVIKAAFSTHTITTLLTSTGNKLLLEGFAVVPQKWRSVAQVRTVTDFKTVTAYRMTASLEYEEVGPAGEIKHGTMGQESYTMAAKTYAKMAALTRQDIINDDLGAFNDLRSRLGVGAAQKLAKIAWQCWLTASNGAAFWTAARGNLQTSSALADSTIGSAVALFRNMTDADGTLFDLEPKFLLVPPGLEATARKFYVSQEIRDTTASTRLPTANIWQNQFTPIVVPELANSNYTGYSATTWWLLADPAVLASMVVCFLNGQESPTIESADADFNTLGIQFRGYHDFGAAATEYRASVKSTA